jgi:hypothetical protein
MPPPDPFIISEAAKGRYIEESRRRMLEDNQRVAEAAQRQREREEREAAEARTAQEAARAPIMPSMVGRGDGER